MIFEEPLFRCPECETPYYEDDVICMGCGHDLDWAYKYLDNENEEEEERV